MSTAAELFSYNRENFKFNMEQRQKSLHMQQNMRVRQVLLYRQDMKDLFELTVGKMDAYMMVNVLMLGISSEMYYKGRAPLDVPSWLFWCWAISLSGAFFFLFFSTWLALHASVLAQTYMARCLTQWLRLPIPSIAEIDAASARLEEYESNSFLDFVRPPVVVPMGDKMGNKRRSTRNAESLKDLSTSWNEFLDHFSMFNSLHHKWSSQEAYARVAMCVGTNQLLAAFSYYALSYYSVDFQNPWVGTAFVLMATLAQLIYLRMSLNLTEREHYVQIVLLIAPPLLMTAGAALCSTTDPTTHVPIIPDSALILAWIGYVLQFCWMLFFLSQTKHDSQELPIKFSTVWCIDVLGVGVRTIRDIEEPRVDFPGFVSSSGEFDLLKKPFNTYDLSHSENKPARSGTGSAADAMLATQIVLVSQDVIDRCRAQEKKLHGMFALWAKRTREDLTDQEVYLIEELQSGFQSDKDLLDKVLVEHHLQQNNRASSLLKSGLLPSTEPTKIESAWVRINHETDTGDSVPYMLNIETGEIRVDDSHENDESTKHEKLDDMLHLDQVPLEVHMYHEYVRKIGYAVRREEAYMRQRKTRPPTWPYEFFRAGGVLILMSWIAALVETILHRVGFETTIGSSR